MPVLPVVYGAVLAAFTSYVMLDTFVLPSTVRSDASQMDLSMFEDATSETQETAAETQETAAETQSESTKRRRHGDRHTGQTAEAAEVTTETTEAASDSSGQAASGMHYEDEHISVTVTEYDENDTTIYVADVQLSSARYLKTAFAEDTFGKNITAATSEIAAEHGAILAVNGDFCGARTTGYVIRNGIVYRDTGDAATDVLCIYADGHFEITNAGETTAQALADAGVWQAFSFGPALVQDGAVTVSEGEEVGHAMASNPRTAIGIIDDLHYVLVVSDGRTDESAGLTLQQLASFMQGLGVTTAYNLDGGGSSTMYWNGQVINEPTTSGRSIKERSVSDIVYIGS
ncbi:MAG: phosphodiester glycosidase family protein [Oscillospiraceae bacterium]|nr:phosphodiester glycosidase family protein [Oscillospiraceae bacterium]